MPNNDAPHTQVLRESKHFQALATHAPKLAHAYLTAVDKDYATAPAKHQKAYLAYVTKEKAEESKAYAQPAPEAPKVPEEAPEPINALNQKLMAALALSKTAQDALTKAGLGNQALTRVLSRLSRSHISALAYAPDATVQRRRITKGGPAPARRKPRL
jgi:hypothetical protein